MTEPRLRTEIRISAHLRRAQSAGAFATVVRRGDPDAGAIAVKLFMGRGRARLFIQSRDLDGAFVWREPIEPPADEMVEAGYQIEVKIDQWLTKEVSIDPDLWVVEIEDREGRAFLE